MTRIKIMLAMVLMFAAALLGGCQASDKPEKANDLDFTVVAEQETPQELKGLIEERKTSPFKLTYSDEADLYLVVGYGEQKTGGYSVQVKDIYLTKDSIYLNTELLGPDSKERVTESPSYPYIVIKIQYREEPVIFE